MAESDLKETVDLENQVEIEYIAATDVIDYRTMDYYSRRNVCNP